MTETLGCRRDGSTFPMEVEHGELSVGDRSLTLASVRDISERKAYTEALQHQALHDGLTGLANRTLFGELVLKTLASAKRAGEPRAVLVMDLDGFKQVNDTLGHEQGDALLKQVGERLVAALREIDTVARLGRRRVRDPARADDRPRRRRRRSRGRSSRRARPDSASAARPSTCRRASASPCSPSTARTAERAAAPGRRGDVRSPSGPAAATPSSTPRRRRRPRSSSRCSSTCASASPRDELVLHYQPKIDLDDRVRSPASRRSSAGATPTRGLLLPGQLHARGGAHRADRAGDEMGAQRGAAPAAGLARRRASISRWRSTSPRAAWVRAARFPRPCAS